MKTLTFTISICLLSFFTACKVQPLGTLPTVDPIEVSKIEYDFKVETTLLDPDLDMGIKSIKVGREKGTLKNKNLILLGKCPYPEGGGLSFKSRERLFRALYEMTDVLAMEDWFGEVVKELGAGEKSSPLNKFSSSGFKNYFLQGVSFDLGIAVCLDTRTEVIKKTKVVETLKVADFEETKKEIMSKLADIESQIEEQQGISAILEGKVNRAYGSMANMASRANMNRQINEQYYHVKKIQRQLFENIKKLEEVRDYYSHKLAFLNTYAKPVEKELEKQLTQISGKLLIMGIPFRIDRMFHFIVTGTDETLMHEQIVTLILSVLEKGY